MRVELLSAPGCPNAAAAKTAVSDCLTALGIDVPIIERVGSSASPTVLIDGVDVMRPDDGTPEGDACRCIPDGATDSGRPAKGADMTNDLMRGAVRLLARGAPVTAARNRRGGRRGCCGSRQRACGPGHRIRRQAPHRRMGSHSHSDAAHIHCRRPSVLHLVRRGHPDVPGDHRQPRPGRVTLSHNGWGRPLLTPSTHRMGLRTCPR